MHLRRSQTWHCGSFERRSAHDTGMHAPSLYRILRLLTATDLLFEGEDHSFALTPLGAFLQRGVPGSMRDTVLFYCDKPFWQVWGDLLHSAETGETGYQYVFGLSLLTIICSIPSMQHFLTI